MTFNEFAAVYNARMRVEAERENRANERLAVLLAELYNSSAKWKGKAKAADFLRQGGQESQPHRQQTTEEMIAAAQRITRMLGGKVVRKKKEG